MGNPFAWVKPPKCNLHALLGIKVQGQTLLWLVAHVLRQISIEGLPVAAMKALMAAEGTTHERRRRSHLVKFVAVVTERGGDVNAPSLADVCAYLFDFFERNGNYYDDTRLDIVRWVPWVLQTVNFKGKKTKTSFVMSLLLVRSEVMLKNRVFY